MASIRAISPVEAFQNSIDDIRNLASCKVCLRPFYEPFILRCGHTFCYGCLRSWFCGADNRKTKKNCPECRSAVRDAPAPNYILRDLAHMLVDRAELLPEGETLDEHNEGKTSEAKLLADDRKKGGPGLFKNMFTNKIGLGRMMWDQEDNVYRCPLCGHEMEDGMCSHCSYEDSDAFSESMGSDSVGSDAHIHASNTTFATGYPLIHLSPHIPLRLPYNGDDHGMDGEGEGSDSNTDHSDEDDPIPWGYPPGYPIPSTYEQDEDDEEEDENAWQDQGEMDSFIDDDDDDDDDYPDDVDYDSAGLVIEDYTRRPWPYSPSAVTASSIDIPAGQSDADSRRFRPRVLSESEEERSDGAVAGLNQTSDEAVTEYDESLNGDEQIASSLVGHLHRRHHTRRVLDDSDDNDTDDHFEDAITGTHSDTGTQNQGAGPASRGQRTNDDSDDTHENSTTDEDHTDLNDLEDRDRENNDESDDESDDDDDVLPAHLLSRRPAIYQNHQEQRRGERRQRNFNEGHGFHPYARRGGAFPGPRGRSERPGTRNDS